MAKTTVSRRHSAPGVYFSEEDMTYSAQSLGITTLGVFGETLKGPAFQPVSIKDFGDFQTYFGGTSTEKYRGSQYPKYELPYIAKTYLEQSKQLEVVRVLGLSGVNAGPAWVITASKYKTKSGFKYVPLNYDVTDYTEGVNGFTWCDDVDRSWCNPSLEDEGWNDGWIPSDKLANSLDYCRKVTGYHWHALCSDLTDEECNIGGASGETPEEFYSKALASHRVFENMEDAQASIPDTTCLEMVLKVSTTYMSMSTISDIRSILFYDENGTLRTAVFDSNNHPYNTTNFHVHTDGTAVTFEYNEIDEEGNYNPSTSTFVVDTNSNITVNYGSGLDRFNGKYNNSISTQRYDYQEETPSKFLWDAEGGTLNFYTIDEDPNNGGMLWYGYISRADYTYYKKTYLTNVIACDCTGSAEEVEVCPTCEEGKESPFKSKDMSCCIDGANGQSRMVVAVLRSRGQHVPRTFVRKAQDGECQDLYDNDRIKYYADCVTLEKSKSLVLGAECAPKFSTSEIDFEVNSNNYGTFTLSVLTSDGEIKKYSVSLNKGEKNYITNVIGTDPEIGEAEIYVEELYDVALEQMITDGKINAIDANVIYYPNVSVVPKFEDVDDIVTLHPSALTKKYKGMRFLYDYNAWASGIAVRYSDGVSWSGDVRGAIGGIYTVRPITDATTGKKTYHYTAYLNTTDSGYRYEEIEASAMPSLHNDYWVSCTQGVTDESITSFHTTNYYTTTEAVLNAINKGEYKSPEYAKENGKLNENSPTYIRIEDYYEGETTYYMLNMDVSSASYSTISDKPSEFVTEFDYCAQVEENTFENCVHVKSDDMTYIVKNYGSYVDIAPITFDFNNYKEQFRYASTPWIVSEIKGSAEHVELHRLFRFHTISDGNSANTEVKVSIENINPMIGNFDVVVRDYNDTDSNIVIVERYNQCTLIPGDPNYIALKIGSFDEAYETVSKYITVEVNEDDITRVSIPAGFLGYPVRDYRGVGITPYKDDDIALKITAPYFRYNTFVYDDLRVKKQYFGVSDIVGIDSDVFSYKGTEAYNGLPSGLTPCFHLDSRILNGTPDANGYIVDTDDPTLKQIVTVDGVTGYKWVTVNKNQTTEWGIEPRIGSYDVMADTIYEDIRMRKFTVCFYGGFDGWDYYRTSRSNSDEFSYNNYKQYIQPKSGYGKNFSILKNYEVFGFDEEDNVINSDYYAYLAGMKQFENNKKIAINVLASPGIDYVNQGDLVDKICEIVEDDRADCIYVVTTPDKPFGASDSVADMYTAEDAVDNLDDSAIDSNYVCTYFPWEKYFDAANNQYIYLPITRDVVRSIAYTDNVAFSWYASAGWNRGNISGIKPKKKLKLSEQDTLYDGRINFVNSFANEGDKIWGDKNLQIADSQLNRLSTRRLLLRIKKLLTNACIGLLFDPNDASTSKTLYSAIDEVLSGVKQNRGIVNYKIVVDDSAERREKGEIAAKYYIQRYPNLEYIELTGVLTSNGALFE